VLAVPVGPPRWSERLAGSADEYVCLETPERFSGVSRSYLHFGQTSDDEVVEALASDSR
jgi:predicted phosphoribosyltransferase